MRFFMDYLSPHVFDKMFCNVTTRIDVKLWIPESFTLRIPLVFHIFLIINTLVIFSY